MKKLTFLVILLVPFFTSAQYVSLHLQHAFGTCTLGTVYDNVPPADRMDSIVWSTGFTGFSLTASPGVYGYSGYLNGAVFTSGSAEILQLDWYWDVTQFWAEPGRPTFHLQAEVPYYGTHIFQYPCCGPQQYDCVAELYQDGVLIDSDNDWYLPPNLGGTGIQGVSFTNGGGLYPLGYDPGHAYQIKFIDNGCGHVFWSDTTIINSCSNLQLDLQVTGSTAGLSNGIIDLLQAIPDTTETYPIYSPVMSSMISLASLYPYTAINTQNMSATSYSWTGLDSGYYQVCFMPDAQCALVCDTVYVPGLVTVVDEIEKSTAVYYSQHTQSLYSDKRITNARIWSANGKELSISGIGGNHLRLPEVSNGVYLYHITLEGGIDLQNRFWVR